MVNIRVYFVVVYAPRVVEICLPPHACIGYLPTVLQPHGARDTPIVLECIRRVILRRQIVQTKINDLSKPPDSTTSPSPSRGGGVRCSEVPLFEGVRGSRVAWGGRPSLPDIHEFAESVCFESSAPRGGFLRAFYLHHAACHIAIFRPCYAAYNLHFFNIIRRDGTHIHTFVHRLPLVVLRAC